MNKCRLIVMFAVLLMGALTASAQTWIIENTATGVIGKHQAKNTLKCHEKDSKIRFNDLYGEVNIRCDFEDDDAYEYANINTVIYEEDRIKTFEESGCILGLEDMSTYVIKEESILIIHTEEDNTSKLEWIAGTMWANIKKMAAGKTLEVDMVQCVLGVEGTIFAVEQKNGVSKVWLFAGKTNVKSKKTGKKTVMSPGQTVSVGKDGVAKVQTFNIEQGAKKFGIKMSDINNHYSSRMPVKKKNKTVDDAPKTDRYNVKCAVVKYKYTKGKVTGQHERAFDNYGKLERRTFKTPTSETISYYRENKIYSLDVKKKTMKVKVDNDLNFGNPDAPNVKKMRKSGSATVLGKTCAIYQSGNTDYYVWQGIVLKKVDRPEKGDIAITEAISIQQPASLNASMFEVPKGYTVK